MPAGAAAAAILLRLLDTIDANVAGVLADTDTEFLHDLRVSVRRTRSALKLFGDALTGLTRGGWRSSPPSSSGSATSTTPTRDLDVHLLDFEETAAAWPRRSRTTSSRSAPTWSSDGARSSARWSAGCARPGSPR